MAALRYGLSDTTMRRYIKLSELKPAAILGRGSGHGQPQPLYRIRDLDDLMKTHED